MNAGMNAPGNAVPMMHFSTDMFPQRGRATAWREFFGRGIMKLEIEPLTDCEFRSSATLGLLPDLGFVAGTTNSPIRFDRPAHMIDSDDAAFALILSGKVRVAVRGHETMIQTGDAFLMGAGEGGVNEAYEECRFVTLRMPRRAIAGTSAELTDLLGHRIPADTPALRLLRHYIGILNDPAALATPDVQRAAATHIHDLIALTLGATRDAAHVASGRGLAAARLKAIKDDIARNIACEDLSVGTIALRHQVTPRYIGMLFENEGMTFTEYVLSARLARAHRMLGDLRQAGEKISSVALDAGFSDLSYFYRVFRRRYGQSPSDVRANVRRDH